jgi:hypothetical protein
MMESIINAAFDRGDFLRIELVSTNGTSLIVKSRKIDTTGCHPGLSGFYRLTRLQRSSGDVRLKQVAWFVLPATRLRPM